MMTSAAFHSKVMESMEAMTDQIMALRAISGMMAAIESNPVTLSELTYLLDPIIDKQKALVEDLMNTKNVAHSPPRPSQKSKPVLVSDNT